MASFDPEIAYLTSLIDPIRRLRDKTCEPKANSNPRYLALSNAISGINKAIEDMRHEG